MGRRKVTRKKIRRKTIGKRLETRFSCPRCNNEQAIVCKVDKKNWIGTAICQLCGAEHSCKANNLTYPIDIYSHWIDEINK